MTEQYNSDILIMDSIPTKLLGIEKDEKEGEHLKISTKGQYGLRALIDLAQYSEDEPISISSIAARQNISERYLEQLMAMLKKANLVKSIRGASGGYFLAKPGSKISVGDVLRALEGNIEPVECAAYQPEEVCEAADSCVTKYVWQKINESINQTVDEIMIEQLVAESKTVKKASEHQQRKCNK